MLNKIYEVEYFNFGCQMDRPVGYFSTLEKANEVAREYAANVLTDECEEEYTNNGELSIRDVFNRVSVHTIELDVLI